MQSRRCDNGDLGIGQGFWRVKAAAVKFWQRHARCEFAECFTIFAEY
jgi:hypothetical protein